VKTGLRVRDEARHSPGEKGGAPGTPAEPRPDAAAEAGRRAARFYGLTFMIASSVLTVILIAVLWYVARRLL
jgi:hypothetical protein